MTVLELGPLVRRLGLALALLIAVCMQWALACTIARDEAIYQATGIASPLLQGSVVALSTPLPGIFRKGVSTLKPLGDYSFGFGSNTLCETWVEVQTGIGNQGGTAYAAAERFASLGLLKPGPPPPGAIVYFGPSPDNQQDGHVGLAEGGGQFRSVTDLGVADAPLAGWPAPYLGYVLPSTVRSDRFGHVVTPNVA